MRRPLGLYLMLFLFGAEVAIWLWLGFSLLSRWNFARIVAIIWCLVTVGWVSYGFFTVPYAKQQAAKVVVYVLTVLIHGTIAAYLMRPRVTEWFSGRDVMVA